MPLSIRSMRPIRLYPHPDVEELQRALHLQLDAARQTAEVLALVAAKGSPEASEAVFWLRVITPF